jgi:hypothetical protein
LAADEPSIEEIVLSGGDPLVLPDAELARFARRLAEIGRVRSWDVRDWMKGHGFQAEAFPNMHLRDEVVERLRMYGLELTPKPLTHTAWEYYNMQYDRHADRRAPMGRRREKKVEAGEVETGEEAAPRGLFGFRKKPVAAETETYEPEIAGEVAVQVIDAPQAADETLDVSLDAVRDEGPKPAN